MNRSVEANAAMNEPESTNAKLLFVAKKLPNGVRFVAMPMAQAAPGITPTLGGAWITAISILTAAFVMAANYIERSRGALTLWISIVSLFYLLQLVWDAYLTTLAFWQITAYSRGKFVIELKGNRLKAGHRWGSFWLSPQRIELPELIRLVIVRRPTEFSTRQTSFQWYLIAQHRGGLPVTLVSELDEANNVRTVGRDLHARLASSSTLSVTLPPLQEELWPTNSLLVLPRKPSSKNMYLRLAGSFGLGCILVGITSNPPSPPWFLGVAIGMILLQGLILVIGVVCLRASRNLIAASRGD